MFITDQDLWFAEARLSAINSSLATYIPSIGSVNALKPRPSSPLSDDGKVAVLPVLRKQVSSDWITESAGKSNENKSPKLSDLKKNQSALDVSPS